MPEMVAVMDLAIIVVSYNTRELLARCLQSVQAGLAGLQYELVVVDNASEDGSAEMVAATFPEVTLVRSQENRGFAGGVNQGIRASTGRYVLLLNSDATVDQATIRSLTRSLDETPRAAAAGGMLLHPDGTFQGSYADFPTLLTETLLATGLSRWLLPPTFPSCVEERSQEARSVDWICGALLLLRRATLEEIGLLDEAYFMYAEEVDWCYRAHQYGWTVQYVPDARAVHHIGASYNRVPMRRREQIYRSKWLFFRKHHGWAAGLLFRGIIQTVSALKLAGWAAAGLLARGARRSKAQGNVTSYRYLLSHF